MNIFHEATKKIEAKHRYNPKINIIYKQKGEIEGIKALYGIEREIEYDNIKGYFLRLPYEIGDIIDEAINIRAELDRKG